MQLLGIASPLSIYNLGIGPYINASWTISLVMLAKQPRALAKHFQTLRRAGREVRAGAHPCFTMHDLSTPGPACHCHMH